MNVYNYSYMNKTRVLTLTILLYNTHLASRNINFKSKLARNINIFVCNLISVIELCGNE